MSFRAQSRNLHFTLAAERVARVIRRVIGVPDYERYVAHLRSCHPELAPLTPEAFIKDTLARRYERPGSRCC